MAPLDHTVQHKHALHIKSPFLTLPTFTPALTAASMRGGMYDANAKGVVTDQFFLEKNSIQARRIGG